MQSNFYWPKEKVNFFSVLQGVHLHYSLPAPPTLLPQLMKVCLHIWAKRQRENVTRKFDFSSFLKNALRLQATVQPTNDIRRVGTTWWSAKTNLSAVQVSKRLPSN